MLYYNPFGTTIVRMTLVANVSNILVSGSKSIFDIVSSKLAGSKVKI